MTGSDPVSEEHILDPGQLRFYRSKRGSLIMRLGEEEHYDFHVRRGFPLEAPGRFIGFFLPDATELGLLEDVDELDEESRRVLLDELDKIYFRPVILRIDDIGEEFGVVHADVETTSGPRHIEIRQIRSNIRLLSDHRALIEDVDGNRYELRDWNRLPRMTREVLGL